MNVFNGRSSYRIELDNTSNFYLCNHFLKAFKDKTNINNAVIIKQIKFPEVLCYCSLCKDINEKYLKHYDILSVEFFCGARRILIQYSSIDHRKNCYYFDFVLVDNAL